MDYKFETIDEKIEKEIVLDNPWVVQHRLGVVNTWWHSVYYVVAVVGEIDPLDDFYNVQTPTEEEYAQLVMFRDYALGDGWYGDHYIRKIKERSIVDYYDLSTTFMKTKNGWVYRKSTWTRQFCFPIPGTDLHYPNLIDLMDKIHTIADEVYPRWTAWKENYTMKTVTDTTEEAK